MVRISIAAAAAALVLLATAPAGAGESGCAGDQDRHLSAAAIVKLTNSGLPRRHWDTAEARAIINR